MASSVIRAVMLIQLEEHQDGHARARARRSYGAVLDGFVESGRFLGQ